MPVLNLPPDSLGPKPTKKQMELLRKIAASGVIVHVWSGIRSNGGAYLKSEDQKLNEALRTEKINQGDVNKFYDWGWLDVLSSDFKGQDYRVSERALKVIEKGETR